MESHPIDYDGLTRVIRWEDFDLPHILAELEVRTQLRYYPAEQLTIELAHQISAIAKRTGGDDDGIKEIINILKDHQLVTLV